MRVCVLILCGVLSGAVTGGSAAAYIVTGRLVPDISGVPASSTAPAAEPVTEPIVAALPAVAHHAPVVDPALRDAAYVFAAKLNWRVDGKLLALNEREGEIEAHWSSPACDWTETEILDLVDTIHREFDGDVRRIVGVRECGGTHRRYSLAGRSFAMYHDGKVSRPEVLKYLIDVHSGE